MARVLGGSFIDKNSTHATCLKQKREDWLFSSWEKMITFKELSIILSNSPSFTRYELQCFLPEWCCLIAPSDKSKVRNFHWKITSA
jgi:hypothetical protein